MRGLTRLAFAAVISAAAGISGCGSSTSIGMVIPPGNIATGSVTGRLPVVEVRNDGPEAVNAQILTVDGEGFDGRLLPGGSATHKLPGPLRLRIENMGEQRAVVHVEAQGADGVTLSMPAPK